MGSEDSPQGKPTLKVEERGLEESKVTRGILFYPGISSSLWFCKVGKKKGRGIHGPIVILVGIKLLARAALVL